VSSGCFGRVQDETITCRPQKREDPSVLSNLCFNAGIVLVACFGNSNTPYQFVVSRWRSTKHGITQDQPSLLKIIGAFIENAPFFFLKTSIDFFVVVVVVVVLDPVNQVHLKLHVTQNPNVGSCVSQHCCSELKDLVSSMAV